MRLWSLHPRYLDSKGLVALWREALLAKHVLANKTKGYRNHPQLERFKQHSQPQKAIDAYLAVVHSEAQQRRYSFDKSKIGKVKKVDLIPLTSSQLKYEFSHLVKKLALRDPKKHTLIHVIKKVEPHPLFFLQKGPIASWEKVS